MRDLHCFLLKDDFSSRQKWEDLNKYFITNNFKKLRQRKTAGMNRISCYMRCTESEIYPGLGNVFQVNESIRVKYYLMYMVFSEKRIFIITDKKLEKILDDQYIQWDFAMKIALESHLLDKMGDNISFPFTKNYIFSIDRECPEKSLKMKFREKNFVILGKSPLVSELESYCSYLFSIYCSEPENPYFTYYKKINYIDDRCVSAQFEKAFRKNILNKKSNEILITYPSENLFDSESFHYCNGKIGRVYNDVGINELRTYFMEIEKNDGDINLHEIIICPLNKKKERTDKHSLLDLIIFKFEYQRNKYIFRNNSIFQIN